MTHFAVITKVPAEGEFGNHALSIDIQVVTGKDDDGIEVLISLISLYPSLALSLRRPVFALGEIVILGEDGREVHGDGRKPDKWHIEYDTFSDIEEAIARSLEVSAIV